MFLIGLTGPTGSGKGLFCAALARHGVPSIDADAVYHDLLVPPSPCLDALTDHFGREILREDGTLDRKALAAIVFGERDPALRAEKITHLNRITHGFVLDRADEILHGMEKNGIRAAIFDAPALYESGADRRCDLNVTVLAERETRIKRIIARDGLSEKDAEARVSAQHPDSFYTERADAVLRNDASPDDLFREADRLYTERIAPHL